MIQGLLMGLAKGIAVKIMQKRYAGTEKAEDVDAINSAANSILPLVIFGMLAGIGLIIWFIVAVTSC